MRERIIFEMSVAVIGPPSLVTAFELIGAEGFELQSDKEAEETLRRVMEEERFMLIIVPERLAEQTRPIRELVMKGGKIAPVFALIPDFSMETGMRMKELQDVVSLAIGTKLEL
jgi:vacuolar-type H+-ATPase subunit F/Vma7